MARCGCGDSCACVIASTDTVTVLGVGSPDNPYRLSSNDSTGSSFTPPPGTPDDYFPVVLGTGFQWLSPAAVKTVIGADGGGGGTDSNAVHYSADSGLTDAKRAAALKNIRALPSITPESFGAAADGITDDSLAIYAAIQYLLTQAIGGGVLQLTQGKKYYVSTAAHAAHSLNGLIDLAPGIYIDCAGGSGRATYGAATIIGDHTFSGYIVDTPLASIRGCGLSGIIVQSDMSSAGATPIGGVRLRGVTWGHVIDCGIANLTDTALNVLGCVDLHLQNLALSRSTNGRTLTSVTPTFFLSGTDHVCVNIQANGGNNQYGTTISTLSSTNFYNAAIQLFDCDTVKFYGVNGEFADVGWYLGGPSLPGGGGTSTHVSLNQMVDVRGDYNSAHGFYAVGAAWNVFVNCTVYNNSNNANGAYDGVYLDGAAVVSNRWTNLVGGSPVGNANIMGFYFNDHSTGTTQLNANMVNAIGGMVQGMTKDFCTSSLPFRFSYIRGDGVGSYTYRMASRHCAGSTWVDTDSGALCYSDGANWRLVGTIGGPGAIWGNILTADTSECAGGVSTGWQAVLAGGTQSATWQPTPYNTVSSVIAKLGHPCLKEVTCNGVVANTAGIWTKNITIGAGVDFAVAVATIAASSVANVKFIVSYYTSGGVFISSDTTDGGSNNSAATPALHSKTGYTTPATTGLMAVQVVFTRTGMASGEKNYIGLMSVDTHSTQTIPVYS